MCAHAGCGEHLEPRGPQRLARVRANVHQERVPVVLLVAVRPAPPRDDARRGFDGEGQGVVQGHAARIQRQVERLVQRTMNLLAAKNAKDAQLLGHDLTRRNGNE